MTKFTKKRNDRQSIQSEVQQVRSVSSSHETTVLQPWVSKSQHPFLVLLNTALYDTTSCVTMPA